MAPVILAPVTVGRGVETTEVSTPTIRGGVGVTADGGIFRPILMEVSIVRPAPGTREVGDTVETALEVSRVVGPSRPTISSNEVSRTDS